MKKRSRLVEAIQLQKLLERNHVSELKPMVDHVLDYIQNPSNRYKIIINYTDRGMGYDLQWPNSESLILRGEGELGLYVIYVDDIPYYTGEGKTFVRIGRFIKAVLGDNRPDENHKAGDWIYNGIQKGNLSSDIYSRFHVSFISINELKPLYDKTNLNFFSPLENINFDTKEHIKQTSRFCNFDEFKPFTYYIEKIIMNEIGSILNTNNMSPSDIKFINESKFWKKGFVSKTY